MSTRTSPADRPEQLTMLAPSDLPLQFRLDQRTRLRGLAHIAEIRQQLASRQMAYAETSNTTNASRRNRAA